MKKYLLLFCPAAFCLAFSGSPALAQTPPPAGPATVADLMRLTNTKPITFPESAKPWKETYTGYHAWLSRVLGLVHSGKANARPGGEAVVVWAQEALKITTAWGPPDISRCAAHYQKSKTLPADLLNDPYIQWLQHDLARAAGENEAVTDEQLDTAEKLLKDAGYSALLSAQIHQARAASIDRTKLKVPHLTKAAEAWLATRKEPGLAEGDEVMWYLNDLITAFTPDFERDNIKLFTEYYTPLEAWPRWASETLSGMWQTRLAWGRSNGTIKSGPSFEECMDKARFHFLSAWKLNPAIPYGPSKMLELVATGNGGPGDTLQIWFDRAIAASCDYPAAYNQMITRLPKEAGNLAAIKAFALSCAATKRFDTEAPWYMIHTLNRLAKERKSGPTLMQDIFQDPLIQPALLYVCAGYAKAATVPDVKALWLSNQAIYAFLSKQYSQIGPALKELNGPLSPRAVSLMRTWQVDALDLEAYAAAAATGQAKALDAAVAQYQARAYGPARAAFIQIGRLAGAAAQPAMRRWLSLIQIEESLAKGETVSLTTDPGLSLWYISAGDWKGGPDHSITATGWNGFGNLLHRARFGDKVELAADAEFTSKKPIGQGISLNTRGRIYSDGFAWSGCLLHTSTKEQGASLTLDGYIDEPRPVLFELKEMIPMSLKAVCENGFLTFSINGKTHFNRVQKKGENSIPVWQKPENFRVGFSHHYFIAKETVTLHNIKVRRIP
jgi:hypothetical protein